MKTLPQFRAFSFLLFQCRCHLAEEREGDKDDGEDGRMSGSWVRRVEIGCPEKEKEEKAGESAQRRERMARGREGSLRSMARKGGA